MLTPLLALAPLLLVAAAAAGCTDAEEQKPADVDEAAVRAGLVGLWVGDDASPEDTATGECFADALLAASTPERLRDAGVLDASYAVVAELPFLDEEGAGLWVDAQLACTDFVEESTRAQVAATKGAVDRTAYAACLRGALTEDQLRAAAEAAVMGDLDAPAVTALSQAQVACAARTDR